MEQRVTKIITLHHVGTSSHHHAFAFAVAIICSRNDNHSGVIVDSLSASALTLSS
jgi:hypothetical protein